MEAGVSPGEAVSWHRSAMGNFNPSDVPPRPCWHCVHFLALATQGSVAVCGRGAAWYGPAVVATPQRGCAHHVREVGVDDEPQWVPKPLDPATTAALIARLRDRAAAAQAQGARPVSAKASRHRADTDTPSDTARPAGVPNQA